MADDETRRAIAAKIAFDLEAVLREAQKVIVQRSSGSNGPQALHQALGLLENELIPQLGDKLIAYCIDVGLRDAEAIARELRNGLGVRLAGLGASLAGSVPGLNPGMALRAGAQFDGSVAAYMNQLPARALVELKRKRPTDPPQDDDREPALGSGALVFVSCGQCTPSEIALGEDICALVDRTPGLRSYFAQRVNSFESLSANIFQNLSQASALVAVMHHRGEVSGWNGTPSHTRASVWVEQEIAIAAFISVGRSTPLRIAAYMQKGVMLEGLRGNLMLNPMEFSDEGQVLEDLVAKLNAWQLRPVRPLRLR